jgi:hypothetical protein
VRLGDGILLDALEGLQLLPFLLKEGHELPVPGILELLEALLLLLEPLLVFGVRLPAKLDPQQRETEGDTGAD